METVFGRSILLRRRTRRGDGVRSLGTRRRAVSGSAAVAACATLIICMILALGMVSASDSIFLSGQRQMRQQGAAVMADAGIEYGYWQYAFAYRPVPFTLTRSLGAGQFTVTASVHPSIPGAVKIDATGTQNGKSATASRVFRAVETVFDYTLCSRSTLTGPDITVGTAGARGDTRSNVNISLSGASAVNGDAEANGTITVPTVTGTRRTGMPQLTFPAINLSYYQGIADRTFAPTTVSNMTVTLYGPNEVVYVTGDLTFSNVVITGTGTVVVAGRLYIAGNVSYLLSTDKLAVVAANGISVTGSNVSAVGFYYTHNATNTATAALRGRFRITKGCMIADIFTFQTTLTDRPYSFVGDADMTPTLARNMSLPGY